MSITKLLPYTEEQSQNIVARYQAGDTVEQIAESIDRSMRSVIAKLVRESVYISRTGQKPTRATKAELVEAITEALQLDLTILTSLEKATHEALQALHDAVVKQPA